MKIQRILVVCIGNICRSPMAEALLREALSDTSGIVVESAGLGALVDQPASEFSVELMREAGIDISGHRARQLNGELLDAADIVLVMETGHKTAITENEPTARGKVYRIGEWRGVDVPDPFRRPRADYEHALTLIRAGVNDWAERIRAM